MAKWLPPNGFACTVHHLGAKVGGSFRMTFRNFSTGKSHSFGGQYLEPRHSGGSLLSRLAGFVAKSRESRRARYQSIGNLALGAPFP